MRLKSTFSFSKIQHRFKFCFYELEKAFDGRKIIGNKSASGTNIINELAEEEIKINDIFSGKGISKHCPSSGDANGMDITIDLATEKSNDKKN